MKLSDRRERINASGIRKAFDLAAKLKDPINLSIGLPDFDVPEPLKESAIAAIRAGKNRYTLTSGIVPLRAKVAQRYASRGVDFEDVIITSGTSGGLLLVFLSVLDPGDEVLIPDPYFVIYKSMIEYLGAKAVLIDTYPDFRLTAEAVEAALTPRTRMLILNSPANPTGIMMTEEECRAIARVTDKHGITVMCDEIYEAYSYDSEFVAPSKYFKEPILIAGLSKSAAMTGWRVGWTLGPKDLIQAMTDLQQYTFVCAPSFAQEAALDALDWDTEPVRETYRQRRDIIYQGLTDAGYNVTRPEGAFYIFPEAPSGDGDAFVLEAIENNVIIVPGSVFSSHKTHFRISFATTEEKLRAGVDVLGRLAKRHAAV